MREKKIQLNKNMPYFTYSQTWLYIGISWRALISAHLQATLRPIESDRLSLALESGFYNLLSLEISCSSWSQYMVTAQSTSYHGLKDLKVILVGADKPEGSWIPAFLSLFSKGDSSWSDHCEVSSSVPWALVLVFR